MRSLALCGWSSRYGSSGNSNHSSIVVVVVVTVVVRVCDVFYMNMHSWMYM